MYYPSVWLQEDIFFKKTSFNLVKTFNDKLKNAWIFFLVDILKLQLFHLTAAVSSIIFFAAIIILNFKSLL